MRGCVCGFSAVDLAKMQTMARGSKWKKLRVSFGNGPFGEYIYWEQVGFPLGNNISLVLS